MAHILIIDDEPDVRHVTRECLSAGGFRVDAPAMEEPDISRSTAESAVHGDYDLIILDLRLPHLDPFELIMAVKDTEDGPPIMILAGFLSLELESKLRALGIHTFTTKPFTFSGLLSDVNACLTGSAIRN